MAWLTRSEHWNVTPDEVNATYPCDAMCIGPHRSLTRAMDVQAPAAVLFRWVCQLRIAPYSYDWLDNRGRQSPRQLTPELEHLAEGQQFLVMHISTFEPGRQITGQATPAARRLFGLLAGTYQVVPRGSATSRLIVRLNVEDPGSAWRWARHLSLTWGDLFMMRRQLRTLARLAEQSAGRGTPPHRREPRGEAGAR